MTILRSVGAGDLHSTVPADRPGGGATRQALVLPHRARLPRGKSGSAPASRAGLRSRRARRQQLLARGVELAVQLPPRTRAPGAVSTSSKRSALRPLVPRLPRLWRPWRSASSLSYRSPKQLHRVVHRQPRARPGARVRGYLQRAARVGGGSRPPPRCPAGSATCASPSSDAALRIQPGCRSRPSRSRAPTPPARTARARGCRAAACVAPRRTPLSVRQVARVVVGPRSSAPARAGATGSTSASKLGHVPHLGPRNSARPARAKPGLLAQAGGRTPFIAEPQPAAFNHPPCRKSSNASMVFFGQLDGRLVVAELELKRTAAGAARRGRVHVEGPRRPAPPRVAAVHVRRRTRACTHPWRKPTLPRRVPAAAGVRLGSDSAAAPTVTSGAIASMSLSGPPAGPRGRPCAGRSGSGPRRRAACQPPAPGARRRPGWVKVSKIASRSARSPAGFPLVAAPPTWARVSSIRRS